MKKVLILSICLMFKWAAHSQKMTLVNGEPVFETINQADSLTAAQIHERALNWLGSSFKSAKSVITSDTPSKIVGKFYQTYGTWGSDFEHTLTIDIKEGKYKLRIVPIGARSYLVKSNGTEWKDWYANIHTQMDALFASLDAGLSESINQAQDW